MGNVSVPWYEKVPAGSGSVRQRVCGGAGAARGSGRRRRPCTDLTSIKKCAPRRQARSPAPHASHGAGGRYDCLDARLHARGAAVVASHFSARSRAAASQPRSQAWPRQAPSGHDELAHEPSGYARGRLLVSSPGPSARRPAPRGALPRSLRLSLNQSEPSLQPPLALPVPGCQHSCPCALPRSLSLSLPPALSLLSLAPLRIRRRGISQFALSLLSLLSLSHSLALSLSLSLSLSLVLRSSKTSSWARSACKPVQILKKCTLYIDFYTVNALGH
jgi:hypothetical protein